MADNPLAPEFNPLEDDRKLYSRKEWAAVAKAEIDRYASDDHKWLDKEPHTWREWFGIFGRYMSW